MKLGIVTYMWGAEWDLPTLIRNCADTGFGGVELRTTHKHGVEVTLNDAQRDDVRRRFEDSPVKCVGLGSACEYHSPDEAVVKRHVELTKQFVILSHDVGGTGVKVRPNGFVSGEERQVTIDRIAAALRECGEFAEGYGQEIRLEVHGKGTSEPAVIRKIMDAADHPQVVVCWNSNPGELVDGSLKTNFDLLAPKFGQTVHIHELDDSSYPYAELFQLLRSIEYQGWCLSESSAVPDPVAVMRDYRKKFDEMTK